MSSSDLFSMQWELFFRSSFGPLQRAGLRDELAAGEVDFLERSLSVVPQQRVLEVPCGARRHAVELACRGYAVTGIDLNSDVIAAAESRCGARGASVMRQGDMRRLHDVVQRQAYDVVCCLW